MSDVTHLWNTSRNGAEAPSLTSLDRKFCSAHIFFFLLCFLKLGKKGIMFMEPCVNDFVHMWGGIQHLCFCRWWKALQGPWAHSKSQAKACRPSTIHDPWHLIMWLPNSTYGTLYFRQRQMSLENNALWSAMEKSYIGWKICTKLHCDCCHVSHNVDGSTTSLAASADNTGLEHCCTLTLTRQVTEK